jgi:radical SAM family uncharacterized protein/radical SAM-linked protein
MTPFDDKSGTEAVGTLWEKIEPILPNVLRPGRYAGNELNVAQKNRDDVEVRFVLAFPDVYEIGMSHVGFEILYHVLNRHDWIAAERVYSPWTDMETWMRRLGVPLFSLETKTAVRRADVLGITLQYELHYTNILNLLDLADIPIRSAERGERDPLVVAGGPCAFNPEPLADFLDAVVLGDGEEAAVGVAKLVRQKKREKWNRSQTLKALSKLPGVYVPSLYREERDAEGRFMGLVPVDPDAPQKVTANIVYHLKPEYYPSKPLVPLIEVTHDRFSLEIMRGCTRGCRFCNAGSIYRPVRFRPIEELVRQAREVISNTGYDEISLVSLSTSDYPNLSELLFGLQNLFRDESISLSFPSLRPDTFTPEMADFAAGLRKSGLTLAPEAGTQRLRDVINKNNTEEDLLRAVETAYDRGWRHVKLYFMIGLPTETREDLEGIVSMIGKVVALGKRFGRKEIGVSLSPFSPKPQTPFQWEAQDPVPVLEEKIRFLKQQIRWREVKLSWRDPRVSKLETALGRGGREMASVVFNAWKSGARFDAWTDLLRHDLWQNAFEQARISIESTGSVRNPEDVQPWDHLSKGMTRQFFILERKRALSQTATEDCAKGACSDCGLNETTDCSGQVKQIVPPRGERTVPPVIQKIGTPKTEAAMRVRMAYRKDSDVRFTSHLDLLRIFIRAFRRARIRLALTQGFHAHPRLSPGPPLPLGFTSRAEYLDFDVLDNIPSSFERAFNPHLPRGLEVFQHAVIPDKTPALDGSITLAGYFVTWAGSPEYASLKPKIETVLARNSCRIRREKKEVDIRLSVVELTAGAAGVSMLIRLGTPESARAKEVLDSLFEVYEEPPKAYRIERTVLLIEKSGKRLTPMEVLQNA